MLKVLVACEESQRVCAEFRKLGHEAYSCDVQEPSGGHPEWHILGDVLPLLERERVPHDGWREPLCQSVGFDNSFSTLYTSCSFRRTAF